MNININIEKVLGQYKINQNNKREPNLRAYEFRGFLIMFTVTGLKFPLVQQASDMEIDVYFHTVNVTIAPDSKMFLAAQYCSIQQGPPLSKTSDVFALCGILCSTF